MPDHTKENAALKEKISALENERKRLKAEIEKLRHEQNKTTIKKQTSMIEIQGLHDHSRPELCDPELQRDEEKHQEDLEERQRKFEEECEAVRKQNEDFEEELKALQQKEEELDKVKQQLETDKYDRKQKMNDLQAKLKFLDVELSSKQEKDSGLCKPNCEHEKKLEELREKVHNLEISNGEFQVKNSGGKGQLDQLLSEWTVREAEMAEEEEDYKRRLQSKWQERYHEWMNNTEIKIIELQHTNQLLRRMMEGERPGSGDNGGKESKV